MEVLRDRRSFREVEWISIDKVDKVNVDVELHHEE